MQPPNTQSADRIGHLHSEKRSQASLTGRMPKERGCAMPGSPKPDHKRHVRKPRERSVPHALHTPATLTPAARDCPHTLPRGPQGPLKQRMGGTHRLRFSRCSPQPASCATAFPPRHGPLGWGAPPTGTARGRALRRQGSDPNPTPARAGAAATRPPRPELQPSSWTVTGHTIGFALRQTNVFQTVKFPGNDNINIYNNIFPRSGMTRREGK